MPHPTNGLPLTPCCGKLAAEAYLGAPTAEVPTEPVPKPVMVRLDKLFGLSDPTHCFPWGTMVTGDDAPITRGEIREQIPFALEKVYSSDFCEEDWTREEHIRRVAYLVINGWSDPISLNLGCPSFGPTPDWVIEDGNHRVLAAWYLGDSEILAGISGEIDYINEVLGVQC